MRNLDLSIALLLLGYKQFSRTTQLCLDSLLPQLEGDACQLIVLDNGSPDESASQQKIYHALNPRFKSLYSDINLGFAGGMNHLAKQVSADWMMLVGSDTIFPSGSLNRFIDCLGNVEQNVGIVGPLTNEAGTAQKILIEGQTPSELIANFENIQQQLPKMVSDLYRADFFCVAIRKKLWDKLGGLDEIYGRGYYEDFDFCMRSKALGYRSVMLEDVFIYHRGSGSFSSDPEQSKLIRKNRKIFLGRFPKVEMRHLRLDNYLTIRGYLKMPPEVIQKSKIFNLIKIRLKLLESDFPRSFFKRLVWSFRVSFLKKQIDSLLEK